MSDLIVDTSALIAFFIHTEKYHAAVRRYVRQNPTARWVILETVFDGVARAMNVRLGESPHP